MLNGLCLKTIVRTDSFRMAIRKFDKMRQQSCGEKNSRIVEYEIVDFGVLGATFIISLARFHPPGSRETNQIWLSSANMHSLNNI